VVCESEIGNPKELAMKIQIEQVIMTQRKPNIKTSGMVAYAELDRIELRIVEATPDPSEIAPMNSKTAARHTICQSLRTLEPKTLPQLRGSCQRNPETASPVESYFEESSFAPMPQAMMKANGAATGRIHE
jgi:hypothetical protein